MDYPRDLGHVELWEESLERSLARRGRPKRSSVELYRLRGDRDLLLEDDLPESAHYSRLRRRATDHPLVPRPAVAVGGASALALLAVTLPNLLGGRSATKQRVTYAAKVGASGSVGKAHVSSALQPRSASGRTVAGDSTRVTLHTGAPKVLSASESIQQLQRRLGLAADGDFGPTTLRAVKAFQASHGLVVDGIVGPATRAALGLPAGAVLRANRLYFPKPVKRAHHVVHVAPKPVHHVKRSAPKPVHHVSRPHPAPKTLSIAATIRLMQERLGIPADGQFGPATERALKAYQSHHGLVADAILGPATRHALGLPAGAILRPDSALFPHKPVHHVKRSAPKPVHHVKPSAPKPVHHVSRPHSAPKTLSIAATIRLMQEHLGIPADGQFGPSTERALKAYQSHHGLVPDGLLGPATRHALGLPPGPIIRPDRALFPHPAKRRGTPTTHHHSPAPVHHSSPPPSSTGYVNPLAHASVTPERIDAGVDYSGTGSLTALGAGRVTYVGTSGTGWPGAFVEYQLTNGPDAGRFVYYAEGVRPAVSVGQVVQAGQTVANLIPGWSSGIEIGWGSGAGTQPLAQKLGENSFPTAAGESFSALIASLGGPPGIR